MARTVVDYTGAGKALIQKHLRSDPKLHEELIRETKRMLEAGAIIEEVLWMLNPAGGTADRRQEWLADAPAEFADIIRSLPAPPPQRMTVVYLGPEGMFCQFWESITSAPQA